MKQNNILKPILAISGGLIVGFFFFNKLFLLYISLGFLVTGILSGYLTLMIHKVWCKFAVFTGYIQSRIILFIIFCFILTPLAFIRKLTKKNTFSRNHGSMFDTRNYTFNKSDFDKLW